jgi:hypothetical protein
MKSNQTNISDKNKFEMDVKTSKAKTPVKDATPITTNKRLDHHLIDQDLELEDKNGRLLNPDAQLENRE